MTNKLISPPAVAPAHWECDVILSDGGTGEHGCKVTPGQRSCELPSLGTASRRQVDVGGPRVPTGLGPLGLPVADEHKLVHDTVSSTCFAARVARRSSKLLVNAATPSSSSV
jgi:hypothetical protein